MTQERQEKEYEAVVDGDKFRALQAHMLTRGYRKDVTVESGLFVIRWFRPDGSLAMTIRGRASR